MQELTSKHKDARMWSNLMNTPVLHNVSCSYPRKHLSLNSTEETFHGLSNVDWYILTAFFKNQDFYNKHFGVCLFNSRSSVGTGTHTGNDRGCCQPGMTQAGRVRRGMEDYNRSRRWIFRSRQGSSWLLNGDMLKTVTGDICKDFGCACAKEWKWTNLEM